MRDITQQRKIRRAIEKDVIDKLNYKSDPQVADLYEEMYTMKKEGTLAQAPSAEMINTEVPAISKESKTPVPTVNELDATAIKELSALCKKFLTLEGDIKKAAEQLKTLKGQQSKFAELIFPQQLAQLGYIRGTD